MVRLLVLRQLALIWKVPNLLLTLAGALHANKHVAEGVKQVLSKSSRTAKLLSTVVALSLNQFFCRSFQTSPGQSNRPGIQPLAIQLDPGRLWQVEQKSFSRSFQWF